MDKDQLAAAILGEKEYQIPAFTAKETTELNPYVEAKAFQFIDEAGGRIKGRWALAFSGGGDSLVLLDIISRTNHRPLIIHVDSGMEYPETRDYINRTVSGYGLELRTAKAPRSPIDQWSRVGWPMLGKQAARLWNMKHTESDFKLNVSECCRDMKIIPGRQLVINNGANLQLTGIRGGNDDSIRGMREKNEGCLSFNQRAKLWILHPLLGWKDSDISSYIRIHGLERHPAISRGAKTIGCMYCGGGAQFTNSGYRVLRRTNPESWFRFMVEWRAGIIILAIKYKTTAEEINAAIDRIGGLSLMAETRPWIFDFLRITPMKGYER